MEFLRSEVGADPIVVEAFLDASPADVFRAWTEPNLVKCWFGRAPNTLVSASIDLRVGGSWCFVEHQTGPESSGFEGQYVAIKPERLLTFTWIKFATSAKGERTATQPSRVEVSLSTQGTGTVLHVTHSGITEDEMRRGFANGWSGGMRAMRAMLSTSRSVPDRT